MNITKTSKSGNEITRSNKFWDIVELSQLRMLFFDEKELTIEQLANKVGRSKSSVEKKLQKMGLRRYPDAHKYKFTEQFKRAVTTFYEETNGPETCENFNLTQRQLEGLLRRARNLKGLPPIKIGERRNEWKVPDILIMLRYLGLKEVSYIADRIDKTESAVESYLKRRGFRLHYINGLKQEDFYKNFMVKKTLPFMRNTEGAVFIPWVTMEDNLSELNVDQIQVIVIKAMAKFQRFLHNCKTNSDVIIELWNRIEE